MSLITGIDWVFLACSVACFFGGQLVFEYWRWRRRNFFLVIVRSGKAPQSCWERIQRIIKEAGAKRIR